MTEQTPRYVVLPDDDAVLRIVTIVGEVIIESKYPAIDKSNRSISPHIFTFEDRGGLKVILTELEYDYVMRKLLLIQFLNRIIKDRGGNILGEDSND